MIMCRKILVLTDGKAGHENQSKAFARALGCDFDLVEVRFKSKFHKAASYVLDRLGVSTLSLLKSVNPQTIKQSNNSCSYSAVIGTGSGTFYAAKALARKLGVKCAVVLYPRGYRLSTFDCVLAPSFDRPAKAPNVIEIPANLVAADAAFYEKGVAAFREHYLKATGREVDAASSPVAVIIGGPNTCSTMSVDWMKQQLDAVFSPNPQSNNQTIKQSNNSPTPLWVTTSRRTPPDVEALVDSYPWDYKLLYSKDHFNPIPAFVQLAKRLCVTAESTGMLSEACTFGTAEVVALDNLKPGPHKFRRFVEDLTREGYVNGTRKIDLSAQFAAAKGLLGL